MRDWFVKKLLAAVKGGGAVVVTAKEHAHLLACKDVCAEVKSSMQYLKQCATEQQRREYHVQIDSGHRAHSSKKHFILRALAGCDKMHHKRHIYIYTRISLAYKLLYKLIYPG